MPNHAALFCVSLFAAFVSVAYAQDAAKTPTFKKLVLSDKYFAEGAYYGDFNDDGKGDIVAGPYWYAGPDFAKKYAIYDTSAFDPEKYSDNFGTFTGDFNGDGWQDVFICPHPGTQSYWYQNPGNPDHFEEGQWKKHMALEEFGNESPMWGTVSRQIRINGPIYNMNGELGFGTPFRRNDGQDGGVAWGFYGISNDDKRFHRYTHGIGAGDINGDGRTDLLEAKGWWEQPEDSSRNPWKFHAFDFAEAAAQMLVYDFNGDELNDVVCAWHCHLYGIVYWKQVKNAEGDISFEKTEILPIDPKARPDALSFSQAHAFDLADFNGDGVKDFVTGKRFWAHGSKGDVEPDAPAVLYWFETQRLADGNINFVPHLIDSDSGVGTQVAAVDINEDGTPDVIVSNKKGTFVFLSE